MYIKNIGYFLCSFKCIFLYGNLGYVVISVNDGFSMRNCGRNN